MKKVDEYSYIRAFACIAIVFLHTVTAAVVNFADSLSLPEMEAYRSFQSCLKWAVPCFIMVTGMLLLDTNRQISYKKLFSKYILRIIKAIFVFGMIFVVLEMVFAKRDAGALPFFAGLYDVFAGNTWSHMWYLYCLIGLYLLLPFYKMIAEKAKESDMRYLLIVYLAFLSVLPLLEMFGIHCGFYIHVSSIYPFWLFCGYYLKQYGLKHSFAFYLAFFCVSTALLIMFTCLRWTSANEAMDYLFNYNSLIVVVNGVSVLGMIHHLKLNAESFFHRLLIRIDTQSFGIYLVHMIFIWLFMGVMKWNPFTMLPGAFGMILMALVSFVLAYFVSFLLRKVPFFKSFL